MPSKQAAVQAWLGTFGNAFPASAVPENAPLPLITYDMPFGSWLDEVAVQVNIYMQTESEAEVNSVAERIADSVSLGGKCLLCEKGCMWVKRGTPFIQPVQDEPGYKRRLVNLTIEYMTL